MKSIKRTKHSIQSPNKHDKIQIRHFANRELKSDRNENIHTHTHTHTDKSTTSDTHTHTHAHRHIGTDWH